MKLRRIFATVLVLILLLSSLAGCSAEGSYAGDKYNSSAQGNGELSGSNSGSSGSTGVLEDRKLIRKISIEAETEDMDALLSDITARVSQLEGYIESRNIQNGSSYVAKPYRYATLVIRIPAEHLDSFVQQVGETSNIVSTKEASDDVTLKYVATESRLKVLRTEEERLLQFLSQAATVSEMLQIEQRLTDIQSEIESITTQLNTYDNLVDYGTITLNINEVEVYTVVEEEDPTMWQQICDGFLGSLSALGAAGRAIVVFLLGNSPYLILIALIVVGVLLIIKRHSRRKKRRQAPPPTGK